LVVLRSFSEFFLNKKENITAFQRTIPGLAQSTKSREAGIQFTWEFCLHVPEVNIYLLMDKNGLK
jgi:hypothetical protein